jgi:uncharacterized membrane protein
MNVEMFAISTVGKITVEGFYLIETVSMLVEVIAVIIIVIVVLYGTINFVIQTLQKKNTSRARFRQYKHGLGRALLLSLEILVAADVIRTVALEPTLISVSVLGLLVLIRTFLSWSLVVEIEGHWPWQQKEPAE